MRLFLLAFLSACTSQKSEHTLVCQAAEHSYSHLIDGDIDAYLADMADVDSLPADYRQQLHEAYADFLHREHRSHGGLTSALATRDTLLSPTSAYVFLSLIYADSTAEQISLPMVKQGDEWKVKY